MIWLKLAIKQENTCVIVRSFDQCTCLFRHQTELSPPCNSETKKMDGTAFCMDCMDSWIIYMVSRTFPCHSEVKELKIFNINGNMATKEAKQEIKSESC